MAPTSKRSVGSGDDASNLKRRFALRVVENLEKGQPTDRGA